ALHIAMHDAAVMRIRQWAEHGPQHVQHHGHGERPMRLEDFAERAPLDELHGDEQDVGDLPDPIHRHDVRVPELGHHAGLALEALRRARRQPQLGSQDLDGDGPTQLDLAGAKHDAHPAAGELLRDFEIPTQHHAHALQQATFRALDDDRVRLGVGDEHAAPAAELLILGHQGAAFEAGHGQREPGGAPPVTRKATEVSGVMVPEALEWSNCTSSEACPALHASNESPVAFNVPRVESGVIAMRKRWGGSRTPSTDTDRVIGTTSPTLRIVSPAY